MDCILNSADGVAVYYLLQYATSANQHTCHSNTPNEYTSAALLAMPCSSNSGGMCVMVPYVFVTTLLVCCRVRDSPKSDTLATKPRLPSDADASLLQSKHKAQTVDWLDAILRKANNKHQQVWHSIQKKY